MNSLFRVLQLHFMAEHSELLILTTFYEWIHKIVHYLSAVNTFEMWVKHDQK